MKTIFFALLSIAPMAHAQTAPIVESPMTYARETSKNFAMGDMNDASGWNGCWQTNKSRTAPQIHCDGKTTILVFGGKPQEVPFTCEFSFQKQANGFAIVAEDCQ